MFGGGDEGDWSDLGFAEGDFDEGEPCEVWACNWASVMLFRGMASQWRIGFAGRESLDLAALPVVARAMRISVTPRRLTDLEIMANAVKRMSSRRAG